MKDTFLCSLNTKKRVDVSVLDTRLKRFSFPHIAVSLSIFDKNESLLEN
jgi:hypothetical protein